MKTKFTAVIKQNDGWWIGWVEESPGVNSQGKTRAELLKNLRSALKETSRFDRRGSARSALSGTIASLATVFVIAGQLSATTIEFSGGTTPETIPWTSPFDGPSGSIGAGKPVIVGVAADGFSMTHGDKWSPNNLCKYGVDDVCNMSPDYYFRMVNGGDFTPVGETTTVGLGSFSGQTTASGIEGKQLWMIIWDKPEKGTKSVIVTSLGNPNWIAKGDLASDFNQIDLRDVNSVQFGGLEDGRVVFLTLPIPEPNAAQLAASGFALAALAAVRRRQDVQSGG